MKKIITIAFILCSFAAISQPVDIYIKASGGSSASADSSVFQTKYRSDTGRVNTYTAIASKGTGTVTSITAGVGLIGGTITTSGTINADTATVLLSKAAAAATYLNIEDCDQQSVSIAQALGSTIKAEPVGMNYTDITSTRTLSNQQFLLVATEIKKAQPIAGVLWYQSVQGDYATTAENRVGLYTYSGGTYTLVASSTHDGDLWKAASNTFGFKYFSSPYLASVGTYFIGALWNRSAQTVAPVIGVKASAINAAALAPGLTNSAKVVGVITGQTTLPSSFSATSVVAAAGPFYFALY